MRVPKAKGTRRRYFKPSPSMPSLTPPLCLHTHADGSLCVCTDRAHFHQVLSAPLTDTLILLPSKTHPAKPKGGGVLKKPPKKQKTFSQCSSSWPVPTRFSFAPTAP